MTDNLFDALAAAQDEIERLQVELKDAFLSAETWKAAAKDHCQRQYALVEQVKGLQRQLDLLRLAIQEGHVKITPLIN